MSVGESVQCFVDERQVRKHRRQLKVSSVALQGLAGGLKFRFSGSTLGIRSVKTLTGLEHFPLRTGRSENRRAQRMVGRRALPFTLRLLSILCEAQEFLLQLFQQRDDLVQTVGNLVEASLSCVRAGCVTNVDSLWLLPGAGEST